MRKTMKAIMTTTKRNIVTIVMVVALALPAIAVEYGNMNPYGTGPQVSFRSTSTMAATGSAYSSNPTIGVDGRADYESTYSPGRGPFRAPEPISNDEDFEEYGDGLSTPLGDEVLPLMLLAMLYAAWIAIKRRRKANS